MMLPIATCHTLRQLFPICQELPFLYSSGRASFVTLLINTGVELCVWMLPGQGGRARRVLGDSWGQLGTEGTWAWQGWSCCHKRIQLCPLLPRQQKLALGVGQLGWGWNWAGNGEVAAQTSVWTGSTSQGLSSITAHPEGHTPAQVSAAAWDPTLTNPNPAAHSLQPWLPLLASQGGFEGFTVSLKRFPQGGSRNHGMKRPLSKLCKLFREPH